MARYCLHLIAVMLLYLARAARVAEGESESARWRERRRLFSVNTYFHLEIINKIKSDRLELK